jgi:hypothetical protein
MKKIVLHNCDTHKDGWLLFRAAMKVRQKFPDEVEGEHIIKFDTEHKVKVWSTVHTVNAINVGEEDVSTS